MVACTLFPKKSAYGLSKIKLWDSGHTLAGTDAGRYSNSPKRQRRWTLLWSPCAAELEQGKTGALLPRGITMALAWWTAARLRTARSILANPLGRPDCAYGFPIPRSMVAVQAAYAKKPVGLHWRLEARSSQKRKAATSSASLCWEIKPMNIWKRC